MDHLEKYKLIIIL